MAKHETYESATLGELYFFPVTGRLADDCDAISENEKLGSFDKMARMVAVLARNQDRTPRFSDGDLDKLYDLPATELVDILAFGQRAAGIGPEVADVADVKKK